MDKDILWNQALTHILENVDADDPKSVFLNLLNPLDVLGDQLLLIALNDQVKAWVNKNYLPEIREALKETSGTNYNVLVTSRSGIEHSTADSSEQERTSSNMQDMSSYQGQNPQTYAEGESGDFAARQQTPDWMNTYVSPADLPGARVNMPQRGTSNRAPFGSRSVLQDMEPEEKRLFNKCTFDTFVVGKNNEFARNAALAVAEQPGEVYNPLFIYGSSGLGKTHLLVAIANYTRYNYPNLVTRYVAASDFLNDYVDATGSRNWDSFNAKYHQVDILLVDDVQYLENKGETINQLFNIFNTMTNQSRQIVLSADRAPKDIEMDERMRSRFSAGLTADVKPPDYETRMAIIKKYLARMEETTALQATVPADVLAYLAENSTSNIREIEGAVTRVISHMNLGNRSSITVDEAKEILQDFFPDRAQRKISIKTIQHEVESYFKITHEDLISSKRTKDVTYPRHIAIFLARYMTEESLEAIGKKFGNRDHTTVMHSVSKIEKDQKDNRVLFDTIEQLTIRIKERS